MSIEATPKELAETLVRSTQDAKHYDRSMIIVNGFEIISVTPKQEGEAVTMLRRAFERLIEDERRRADQIVRRAVENAKSEWEHEAKWEYEARLD